jgi:dGTPase
LIEQLKIREMAEEREESLSAHAVKSRLSRGRQQQEEPDPIRTAFQRDRDRIIHCLAFRRLKHKTQVFIAPRGDHYVTRLTHTLEVSQIARTIARALNLNEDLTEAIALGHDLGHTPFGHVGEQVLDELYEGGFRHNEQSLRVVDCLEKRGQGLNLTWEVRDGILNHSKSTAGVLDEWGKVGTLEGEVTRISDIVAYVNHDIDDAIRAEIITEDDLSSPVSATLGHSRSQRINTMVCDIIQCSWSVRSTGVLPDLAITMSPAITGSTEQLRQFLFDRVYNVQSAEKDTLRAKRVLRRLYWYFLEHENELPVEFGNREDGVERRVVDYIAGMTDQFATDLARKLSQTR